MGETDLNIEQPSALIAYLRESGRIAHDESLEIRPIAGGVSNRTVLVRRPSGEAWVLKQALAKLRVEVDWFSDPSRIEREAFGMQWLNRLTPAGSVPELVFLDLKNHLLAMTAVPEPHRNWKHMLLDGELHDHHVRLFAHLLGCIHRTAAERSDEIAKVFDDRRFFESLRLEPYYGYTATQVPEAPGFLHRLIDDTRARKLTLVHGDFSPKNILIHHDRLILLDHEVIHFGDPAFDLGFAMTHLLSKAHHLPTHRESFGRAAGGFWSEYRETIGDMEWANDVEPFAVRHALGCLLARVSGRSPLEYLPASQRRRQREVVTKLMADPPESVPRLAERFLTAIDTA